VTPKQQRFVEEYLVDLNATQAAIRAGYSAKTAMSAGGRLLRNVVIAKAIAAAHVKLTERVGVTQEWVVARLVDNVAHATDPEHFNGNVANRALELLGKHLGMFREVHEHTGKDGKPIEYADRTDPREQLLDVLARMSERREAAQTLGQVN